MFSAFSHSMVECTECGSALTIGADVEKGEIVSCPDCGAELEVMGTDPVVVALAPMEEEDWGE